MSATLYQQAKRKNQAGLVNILVEDGVIRRIAPVNEPMELGEGVEKVDLEGRLVSEPYCDPHIHLDYVFTARSFQQNATGTLFDGIASWSKSKAALTAEEIKARARAGLKEQILGGTQYIRTHIDVTDASFTALKAMLELREEVRDLVEIQIVAFPQEGMYSYKGGAELVEEGLKMGADVVGAIPHFEFTREMGERSVKKVIELALKYDKLVDAHCDETDDEQSRFLELLAAEAYQNGIGEKTTASHTCAMGSYNNAYAFKLMKLLQASGIHIISCPTENIHLQGRYDTYPKRRGLTRVKELLEAGVDVCFAQDSICDPWYPLGNGNLMYVLDFGLHLCHLMLPEEIEHALDLITINGAKTLQLGDRYLLKEGNPANFIVLDAKDEYEAVRNRVGVLRSVRDGKVLFARKPAAFDKNCLPAYHLM